MTEDAPHDTVVEVLGVYDADGGWRGELAYVLGAALGRAHCGLCDITHSPVRRKRAWDRMVARLDVPLRLVHRNELTAQERLAALSQPLPVVLGRTRGDAWRVLVPADRLGELDGSVEAFDRVLRAALVQGPG